MKPLLRISSTPISVEYTTKRASLQHSTKPASVNVTRSRGRAQIQTAPAKVQIDTTEARASVGLKSAARSIRDFAQEGAAAAQEAARNYAEQGNAILDAHGKGSPIADIAESKMNQTLQTGLAFLPSQGPEITVESGSISFDYQMDRLTFDWNINERPQLEFVPASIEFSVAQYPEVVIEYIGSPNYVPPSADPDYVPPAGVDETV